MTRPLDPKKLAELVDLVRLRETVAMGELARIAAAIAALDRRITDLTSRSFSIEAPADALVLQKWQVWQKQELGRLNMQKATYAVQQRTAAQRLGRISAEKSVLEELYANAKKAQATAIARRVAYVS